MGKRGVLLMVLALAGCSGSVGVDTINAAANRCKNNGGLERIRVDNIISTWIMAVCKDGLTDSSWYKERQP